MRIFYLPAVTEGKAGYDILLIQVCNQIAPIAKERQPYEDK
jgi:hypothetical protein